MVGGNRGSLLEERTGQAGPGGTAGRRAMGILVQGYMAGRGALHTHDRQGVQQGAQYTGEQTDRDDRFGSAAPTL